MTHLGTLPVMPLATENKQTKQDDWIFILWKCETTHPSMRPLGKRQTDGCGHWNVRKTKKRIDSDKAQSKCACCGRRKRLNKSNHYMRLYLTKEMAQEAQERLNGGE